MGNWPKRLPVGLAAAQLADAIGNVLVPRQRLAAHLDHLGVPNRLRSALPVIKVAGSAGLVLGIKAPRLGVFTAACLVGYYGAAVAFHARADDHPVVWLPALAFGASAAASLVMFSAHATTRA
ncbi:MAG: DoxX family protein [Acidimicrobiia bacterium]